VAGERPATEARAVVAHNVTAMRAEPNSRAEQTSQVIFGETVRVIRDEDEYTEVQSPDSYQGWVLTRHLSILETGERYPEPSRAAMVAPLFLPVFKDPSAQSERLMLLTLGTAVELAQGDPDAVYYPIRLPSGRLGYVEGGALIVPQYPQIENLGPNLIIVARGLIGVPYLWGGRTPFGLDCSGFVQRVYWLCGHVIPRDAYLQARNEKFSPVERDTLKPGDLVFFTGDHDPRERVITHVGMAMGDGRFIHASGALGVAATPLDEPPYDRQFWGARRLTAAP
jgi:gamma-D-glutamyl-L-lysine dipeptidyl-peptidase